MKAAQFSRTERIALATCYAFTAAFGVFALWYIYTALCMVIPHLGCVGH